MAALHAAANEVAARLAAAELRATDAEAKLAVAEEALDAHLPVAYVNAVACREAWDQNQFSLRSVWAGLNAVISAVTHLQEALARIRGEKKEPTNG